MRNFSTAIIAGLLALISLIGAPSAHAGIIFEKESNDSPEQANLTIGYSNLLTAFGAAADLPDSLDLDYYSFLVSVPGDVQIRGFGKSAGEGLTLEFVTIIVNGPNDQFLRVESGPNPLVHLSGLGEGHYHAIIASGLPQAPGAAGSYRIEIQGINGGTVRGTAAAPEPDTLGLGLLTLIPLAAVAGRWRNRR